MQHGAYAVIIDHSGDLSRIVRISEMGIKYKR